MQMEISLLCNAWTRTSVGVPSEMELSFQWLFTIRNSQNQQTTATDTETWATNAGRRSELTHIHSIRIDLCTASCRTSSLATVQRILLILRNLILSAWKKRLRVRVRNWMEFTSKDYDWNTVCFICSRKKVKIMGLRVRLKLLSEWYPKTMSLWHFVYTWQNLSDVKWCAFN